MVERKEIIDKYWFPTKQEKERTSVFAEVRSVSLKNVCRFMLDIALLRVFSEYLLMFQFVVCRTMDIYAHSFQEQNRVAANKLNAFLEERQQMQA